MNIIEMTDSYKLSHAAQYPDDTTNIASYFESRVGAKYPETTFFGLQYLLRKMAGKVATPDKIAAVASLAAMHLGTDAIFNRAGWEHIERKHYGRLPLLIKAVPEGLSIPTGNVLMTVEATDPKCFWLVNYMETLLVQTWYPSTVATLSRYVKKLCARYLHKTGCTQDGLDFMLHDFGFRGVSSVESAGIGGLAHLVNFKGTDTLAAIRCGIDNYNSGVCGFAVPASEHSTMTSWGRAYEAEAYLNMLKTYPTGIVSIVSDSYDIEAACRMFGTILKDDVLAREGKTVIRPDSGFPPHVVLSCLNILGAHKHFGHTVNSAGFKVLNPKVGVIQGDGCDPDMIDHVLHAMADAGWAASNIVFGMGGGLLQRLDRDTQRFAFKCSAVERGGVWQDVYKNPKGDPTKASKAGRLKLVTTGSTEVRTVRVEESGEDLLQTVFHNGELMNLTTMEAVRRRAAL